MAEHSGRFVAYYRVSTDRQGHSGLGLEAQRKAVADWLNGGPWELVGEYTEAETGKGADAMRRRPKLAAALKSSREAGATLLIAKLDRLARNVAFVSGLMESGVPFTALDMPNAGRFEMHIRAALAEEERRLISERTKAALAAARRRGVKLGDQRLGQKRKRAAKDFARGLRPRLVAMRREGLSQRTIADRLNAEGVPTARGEGTWTQTQVGRVFKRLGLGAA